MSTGLTRAHAQVRELQRQGNVSLVMALTGNKADLTDKRKVETEEAAAYAEENGLFFSETSAKTAANVSELFHEIARKLPKAPPPAPAGLVLDRVRARRTICRPFGSGAGLGWPPMRVIG